MADDNLKQAQLVKMLKLAEGATANGPQWGTATGDLNATLLYWEQGYIIAPHVNNEVDVVFIGVLGEGEVTVDGNCFVLRVGEALLIPKGCERGAKAISEKWSYLSVHKRRAGLAIK